MRQRSAIGSRHRPLAVDGGATAGPSGPRGKGDFGELQGELTDKGIDSPIPTYSDPENVVRPI